MDFNQPQCGKLSIHDTSQHFEKVQSCRPKQLREESTQRPQCESLLFAAVASAHPALMLPAGCGGRYRCVITPDREQVGTQVPRGSPRVQQAVLISGCTQQFEERICSHYCSVNVSSLLLNVPLTVST